MPNELSKLAKQKEWGAILALIGLVGFTVWIFLGVFKDHIARNTDALHKLDITVTRFDETIDDFINLNGKLQASILPMDKEFPYELDPLMTPATSSSEEEWEDFDEPNL